MGGRWLWKVSQTVVEGMADGCERSRRRLWKLWQTVVEGVRNVEDFLDG